MSQLKITTCFGVALLTCLAGPAMAQALRVFEAQGIPQTADSEAGEELPLGSDLLDPEAYDYGEELLRGPVHEAFAEQYNQEPVEGLVVNREPPPDVPEVPPELKPEGDNIEWISGYWFWDDDRDDFIWVSGVWRHIPPGQRWVPGYWAELDGQYQWVGGTWVASSTPEIEYIAQSPPESLDLGPVGNAPSEQHFWIPGCWNWNQSSYAWRPGYWSTGYTNWIWVPQRFLWTPRGYVLCNGYWDYPIASRGTLFAPFWFRRPAYANVGFRHAPRLSLLARGLQAHFWVSPRRRHYLFGDYYDSNYRRAGIFPWHTIHNRSAFRVGNRGLRGYDPLFAHASRTYRQRGINLTQQIVNQYNIYTNRSDRRPPQTLAEQRLRGSVARFNSEPLRSRNSRSDDFWNQGDRLAESIRDRARQTPTAFTRVSTDQLSRLRERALETPALARLRSEIETGGRDRSSFGRSSAQVNSPDPGPNRRSAAARTVDPLPTTGGPGSRGSTRVGDDSRADRGPRIGGDRSSGDSQRPGGNRRTADTSATSGAAQDSRSSALIERLDATINGRGENPRWRLPQATGSENRTSSRSTRAGRELRSNAAAGAESSSARTSPARTSGAASSTRTNSSSDVRSDLRSRMERAASESRGAASTYRRLNQTQGLNTDRNAATSGAAAGRDQRTNRATSRSLTPQRSSTPQTARPQPQVSPSTPPGRNPADRRSITFPGSTQRGAATDALQSLRSRAAEGAAAAVNRNRTPSARSAASGPTAAAAARAAAARATAGRSGANRATDVAGPSIRSGRPDSAGPSIRSGRTNSAGPSIRAGSGAARTGSVRSSGPASSASGRSSAVRGPSGRSDAGRGASGRSSSGRSSSGRSSSGRSGRGRR